MSWMSLAEIRSRIAALQALGRERTLTEAELDEFQRLEGNYCQRLRRLTDQEQRAQARLARIRNEIRAQA